MNISTSVVLLTYKSYFHKAGCVEHTIQSIENQKNVKIECIIVENSGESIDRERLKKYILTNDFQISIKIVYSQLPRGEARNLGAQHATNGIIFFIDDDAILCKEDMFLRILRSAEGFDYGMGAHRPWTTPFGWFEQNSDAILKSLQRLDYSIFQEHLGAPMVGERGSAAPSFAMVLMRTLIANFGFVRNDAFWAVGGFPSYLPDEAGAEDVLLILDLYLKYGTPLLLSEHTVCHMYHKLRYDKLIESQYDQYSVGNDKILAEQLNRREILGFNIFPLLFLEHAGDQVLFREHP
jgi:glycosyltransferase involved in cell wall biosynthesis